MRERIVSQEEATKPGRAFTSSVCLETVISFPASTLLETVLGSEGSAGVLMEKQRKKTGFPVAQAISLSSTYIKFSYSSAVYKAQLPSHTVSHFAVWNTRLHLHIQIKNRAAPHHSKTLCSLAAPGWRYKPTPRTSV